MHRLFRDCCRQLANGLHGRRTGIGEEKKKKKGLMETVAELCSAKERRSQMIHKVQWVVVSGFLLSLRPHSAPRPAEFGAPENWGDAMKGRPCWQRAA